MQQFGWPCVHLVCQQYVLDVYDCVVSLMNRIWPQLWMIHLVDLAEFVEVLLTSSLLIDAGWFAANLFCRHTTPKPVVSSTIMVDGTRTMCDSTTQT